MKKTITCLIAAVFLFTAPAIAKAELPVKVAVDGKIISFPDQQPYINKDNRTMVPVRAPMEAMGCQVEWNDEARQAIIIKGDITATFTIGSNTYTVNGESKTMDTQAVIAGGRTAFPIRFAAEAMGAQAEWSNVSKIAHIFTKKDVDQQAVIKELDQQYKPTAPGTINIDVSKLGKIPSIPDSPWYQATNEQIAELKKVPLLTTAKTGFDGDWAYDPNRPERYTAYDWYSRYFDRTPYPFVSSEDLIYTDVDQPCFRGYMDFEGKGFRVVDLAIHHQSFLIMDPITNTRLYLEWYK
ncbi:MAG: copper amine oxidase N-terminal domain-containing protein [Syntrophomonadaceae bacterium]|nr:copper amine oxidase N-terminal domain-containing protein [Syntrophomonadaceae bacterium]